MTTTYPEVRDRSTLTGVFNQPAFLPIGVEGQMAATGTTATAGLPVRVKDANTAQTLFGTSPLTNLVNFILGRGISEVVAVASKNAAPLLADRQAAWAALEDDPTIRVRLTDSNVQADLVALADSCEQAEGIQNKQFMVGGMAAATTKANLITAAGAIASKRGLLVGPGVYDLDGTLQSGPFGAAYAACEIAKNPDIADSMNKMSIPATAGVEKEAATGLPLFRLRSNAGTPLNDLADLLDGGVSPFEQAPDGRAAFTHLRMTYTTDDTYDSLMTLLIKDGVFLGIRDMLVRSNFLRSGNTEDNRSRAAALVNDWLKSHDNWVEPIELPDGTVGYGVTVVPSSDETEFTVSYFGEVVRGTVAINVNGTLTIPV